MNQAASSKVAVIDGQLHVNHVRAPLADVLGAETGHGENILRNLIVTFCCLFGPILAMIFFTVFVRQPELRWATGLSCAVLPFVGIAISLAWKKPWAVIVEFPTIYRCVYKGHDKAEVDAVTAAVRNVIAQR